jgi:hypothetical protein
VFVFPPPPPPPAARASGTAALARIMAAMAVEATVEIRKKRRDKFILFFAR